MHKFISSSPERTSSLVINSSVNELTLTEYFKEIRSSQPHLLLRPVTTPNSAPFSIRKSPISFFCSVINGPLPTRDI